MRIKRKADYKPDTGKFVKRKVEMDEEIVDLCNKIRRHTNKIEEAISDRRKKNEKRE